MINATQAVQGIQSIQSAQRIQPVALLSTLGQVSHVAQVANSAFAVPGVIRTLGAVSSAPLTYNASGLFQSMMQVTGTSAGVSVSGIHHMDTSNSATTATVAATAFSGTSTVPNLSALLGYGPTASVADALSNMVTSQALPTTIGQALTTLLANEFNPSATIGADMLTVNKALTHLLSSDPNIASASLETASAVNIFGTPNPMQVLSSDLTVQTAINSLLSSPELTSAITQQSLLAQLEADMNQTVAPLASAGKDTVTTSLGRDLPATSKVTPARGTVTATTTNPSASRVPAATAATPATANTAPVQPGVSVARNNNVMSNATGALTTPLVTGSASVNEVSSNTLTSNLVEDASAQAMANIVSNPSYANMASALYLNAALFRLQHDSDTVSPNTGREPQPVKLIPAIRPVILFPFEGSL